MTIATPVAVLPAGQTTWLARFFATVKAKADQIGAEVQDFFQHKAFPFLQTYLEQTVMDEIHALAPLATEAAREVVADAALLFSEPGKFMGAVTAIATSTLQKAEAVGLQVAESSVVTASQAALHNLISAQQPKS